MQESKTFAVNTSCHTNTHTCIHVPIITTTTQKQMRVEERECFLLSFVFFSLRPSSFVRSFFIQRQKKNLMINEFLLLYPIDVLYNRLSKRKKKEKNIVSRPCKKRKRARGRKKESRKSIFMPQWTVCGFCLTLLFSLSKRMYAGVSLSATLLRHRRTNSNTIRHV